MTYNTLASIATIPGREKAIVEAANSLSPQVDQVYIYEGWVDQGDSVKFNGPRLHDAEYYFTADDDLIYPADYVETMIAKIEEYDRKRIVTCQGKFFETTPVYSYYHDAEGRYQCTREVAEDVIVDVGGTGVMAWHRDTINFPESVFGRKNMADLWVAKHATEQGVEIVCIEHAADWILLSPWVDHWNWSIWAEEHKKDEYQTEVLNEILGVGV